MAKVTKKHRLRSFFIGLIGTVIVILGALVIYNHFQKTSRPQTIKLTAVGDSLTQGVGDPKGKGGYVNLIRKKVNHQKSNVTMTTANFGIPGETTNQINHRVVTSKRLKRNLRQADMITVTTGGNDLIQFLKANISLGNNQGLKDHLDSYCVTYQKRVSRLFRSIRYLNHSAPVFVFGIYNPVYVYFPQVSFIGTAIAHNNRITKQVIDRQKNMYFIPIDKKMSDGQYQTASARKRLRQRAVIHDGNNRGANAGIEGLLSNSKAEPNEYLSNTDHFHPNETGYQIMTDLLYRDMIKHTNWLKE